MPTKKLLLQSFDNYAEVAYFDEERPDDLLIKVFEEMEPIIERAKLLSEMRPGEEFRHASVIPQSELDRSYREGWFNDKEAWKKWANDGANRCFRTWPGRL
jgi:hypothetical protein